MASNIVEARQSRIATYLHPGLDHRRPEPLIEDKNRSTNGTTSEIEAPTLEMDGPPPFASGETLTDDELDALCDRTLACINEPRRPLL